VTDREALVCDGCGRAPEPDEIIGASGMPWTWSLGERDDTGLEPPSRLCTACARAHARSIEAKLDAEWW
jgi:hypothetical protein